MKYFMYFLLVAGVFIGLVSTTSKTTKPTEGIYPGDLFPEIENLKDEAGTTINFTDLKGQKVLVNFWASYDADSRMKNVLMSNIIEQNDYPVKMISVSFDKNEKVFEKTIVADNMNQSWQCWADNDLQERLTKLYRLEKGFKSYLIDEDGKIVAMNLAGNDLNQYLEKRI